MQTEYVIMSVIKHTTHTRIFL